MQVVVADERIFLASGGSPILGDWASAGNVRIINPAAAHAITARALRIETRRCIMLLSDGASGLGPRGKRTAREWDATDGCSRLEAHLLRNRFYLGEVMFKGEVLAGEQPAIVDRDLFEAVQAKLSEQADGSSMTAAIA